MQCPVCANEEKLTQVESRGRFSIYSCPTCEVQFADPLSYSTTFYEESYNGGRLGLTRVRGLTRSAMKIKSHGMLGAPQRLALHWLKRHIPAPAPVLELGFGWGWFLAALEQQGYIAMGLEVAKGPVDLLNSKGFNVTYASIESLPSEWLPPRAIALFEVLEHLPDPVGFLRSIHERFPNAPIVLSTPSPKRWTLCMGYREEHDYPPNHLTRWTERALRKALQEAGYSEVICYYPKADAAEFYSMLVTLVLIRLRLLDTSASEGALKDSNGQLLLGRVVTRFPTLFSQVYDIGLATFRAFLAPLATHLHNQGCSSGSMLAIGLPPGDTGSR